MSLIDKITEGNATLTFKKPTYLNGSKTKRIKHKVYVFPQADGENLVIRAIEIKEKETEYYGKKIPLKLIKDIKY